MKEVELSASLADAGLTLLGMIDPATPLIPPTLATFASSCPEEGGVSFVTVSSAEPRLPEVANFEWHRLSREGGLFGEDNADFLVAVNCADANSPKIWQWAKVRLSDDWDIVGAGAASGVLGNGACHPAFVMLSLDGNVIVRGDEGETSLDFTLVRDPHRNQTLRRRGEWMASRPRTDEFTRAALERWLGSQK
ncbi:hypothetical protein ACFOSC_17120 [Streptantibioticus rubrisoli]|uniref:Uncharacterized protein n=1 Tax=Streptantibioticus rubrisoli TaxID=1387313 RepID=A0ABT1PKN3_9ACTN|nr:hypothetical protein [Streptantibioticus rubrisoli]MCQ4045921.1 hypothetical protein [Streptantibioticus rubrisoli]